MTRLTKADVVEEQWPAGTMAGHRRMYQFRNLLNHWMAHELEEGAVCRSMSQPEGVGGGSHCQRPAVEDIGQKGSNVTVKSQFSQTVIFDRLPQNSQESLLTESLIAEGGSSTFDHLFTDDEVESVHNDNYNSSKYYHDHVTSSDTAVTLQYERSRATAKQHEVEFYPSVNRSSKSLTSMPEKKAKHSSAFKADEMGQHQETFNRSQNSQTTDAISENYSDMESDSSWPSVQWTDSSADEFPSLRSRVCSKIKSEEVPQRKTSRNVPLDRLTDRMKQDLVEVQNGSVTSGMAQGACSHHRSSSLAVLSHHSELIIPRYTADTRQEFSQLQPDYTPRRSNITQSHGNQSETTYRAADKPVSTPQSKRTTQDTYADSVWLEGGDVQSKLPTGSRLTVTQQRDVSSAPQSKDQTMTTSKEYHVSKRPSKFSSHPMQESRSRSIREQTPSKTVSSQARHTPKRHAHSQKHTPTAPTSYDYETSYETSHEYESDSRQTLSTQETTNFDDIENEYVLNVQDGDYIKPHVSRLLTAPNCPSVFMRRSVPSSYCFDEQLPIPAANVPVTYHKSESKPTRSVATTVTTKSSRKKMRRIALTAYDNAFKILGVIFILYVIFLVRCMLCHWRYETEGYEY